MFNKVSQTECFNKNVYFCYLDEKILKRFAQQIKKLRKSKKVDLAEWSLNFVKVLELSHYSYLMDILFFFSPLKLPSWFNQASYFATFIAYSNSAVNPIIYGGFNQGFRDALINVFKCRSNETRASLMRPQPTTRTTVGSTVNYTVTGGRAGKRIQEKYVSELVEMKTLQVDDDDEDENEDSSKISKPQPINQVE